MHDRLYNWIEWLYLKKPTYFKFKKEEMIKNVFFDSVPYGYAIFDMILILLIY